LKANTITPQFVEFIPSTLQEGVLYVSQKYGTVAHKCCCGCGIKIVTPITPTDWQLTVSGNEVTLHPSVGNWNHPCQSHYIIRRNRVIWAGSMTQQQINRGRNRDLAIKKAYYEKNEVTQTVRPKETLSNNAPRPPETDLWTTIKLWLKSMFG
jgi:hypothetical protein